MSALAKIAMAVTLFSSSLVNATDIRIDNIRIYQPQAQAFSQPARLYIHQGKIVEVAELTKPIKSADEVIDANNQYAVAGLTDLHVHLGASGSNYSEFQYLPVESHFNSNLYLGVTNIVDLFSFDSTLQAAARLKQTQATPNLFYAGSLFTNPGGHGTQFGGGALEIADDQDIEHLWQQHMARNPKLTKAVIETFGGHGESLTDSQLSELGKRSKAADLPYFVHVSSLEDGKRAIRAGATALAHGINDEVLDDEFIQLMRRHRVAYIPTLSVYFNHSAQSRQQTISSQPHLLATVPEKLQDCLFENVPAPSKRQALMWQKRQVAFDNITRLHQAGVLIGTGSDAGNPYTLHGTALHNELQALHQSGLTAAEVLNAATINSAAIINQQQQIGQLTTGYEASFLLVRDNPLKNLANLGNIQAVYKSGKKIARSSLVAANQSIIPQGKACHVSAQQADKVNKLIDDFNGETKWQTVTDQMAGGQSRASLEQVAGELTITSSLGKATAFGAWTGGQLQFDRNVNATDFKGLEITYKSSGAPIALSVYHSEVKDWDHFSTLIQPSEQWRTVKIPFSQLKQFGFGNQITWSAKNLSGLNFVWRTKPGANAITDNNYLKLDEISYY
ncbi:CIA30 family protein [Thalassomonas haliotis]|uniref:CIA30 family protein n=1 Tax=Thalassomonas haliotis TaxID=485448 RepID=A0ABY7VHY9_9GAMM|nr:CIA30 family protein [Thalassomonas haliotis]WDE13071.1 CIA30 family protein [Thalassomonas haliotis]